MFNKKILLIGDSITEGFDTQKLMPEFSIINKGISGNNSKDLLNRLKTDLIPYEPDIVFVLIGTNDLAQGNSDHEILINIKEIVASIKFHLINTEVYVTSILPTRNNELRPNERIKRLNKKIEMLTYEQKVKYFNLFPLFVDDSENLIQELTEDGLHLNELAYKLWADYLSKFLTGNI